jgi:hypothetical protein
MSLSEPNEVKISIKDNTQNKSSSQYEKKSSIEMAEYPNSNDQTDNDLNVIEDFKVPINLKKTFIFVICLFVLGVVMIMIGTILFCTTFALEESVPFWSIGGIVFIPGGYYAYQFYKAKKSRDLEERNDILEDIPEL